MPNDTQNPGSRERIEPSGWDDLRTFDPDSVHLERNRVVTLSRKDHSSNAIDLLRTRVLNAMQERGWKHLGITSPTRDCGKTFVSANLGFSMARQMHLRTVLCDMDLRNPGLTRTLGVPEPGALGPALGDAAALLRSMVRASDTFAILPNASVVDTAAEALKSDRTQSALDGVFDLLKPDLVLYDLPPALVCDDVLAFKYQLDALLLVTHGSRTTPQQVRDFESLFDGELPILATVLNEAEDARTTHYAAPY